MRIEKSLSKHLSKSLSKSLAGGDTPTPPTVISAIKLTFRPDLRTNVFQHLSSGAGGAGDELQMSYDGGHTWSDCYPGRGVSGGTWTELYIRGKCGSNPIAGICGNFVKVEGNVMTLVDWENPATAELASNQFYNTTVGRGLFQSYGETHNKQLVDASELVLPAMTLTYKCYQSMFEGCTALTSAPSLPATVVGYSSYEAMFRGCTALVDVPSVLPFETAGQACCAHMFSGCESLVTAPSLPATTLSEYCYGKMFYTCYALTTAPVLPATTLTTSCYMEMFAGCHSLNEIHCSATDISAYVCTSNWLQDVSASGDFYPASGTVAWGSGASGIPTNWTVHYPFTDFQEVQYLQSTGTQYINTGFLFTEDLAKVKFKFESTVSGNTYYQYRLGGTFDGSNRSPMLYNSYPTPYIGLGDADIPTSFSIPSLGFTQDVEVDIDNGSYSYTFNGVTETGIYSGSIVTALPYLLFCCNDNNITRYYVSGKLYNFSISKGSTLQLNLIPCYRKSDSVPGMYDSVNHVFYTNANTGPFITGPTVEDMPEGFVQLEYAQGDGNAYIDLGTPVTNTTVMSVTIRVPSDVSECYPFGFRRDGDYSTNSHIYWSMYPSTSAGNQIIVGRPANGAPNLLTDTVVKVDINPVTQKLTTVANGVLTDLSSSVVDWNAPYDNGTSVYSVGLFNFNNKGTFDPYYFAGNIYGYSEKIGSSFIKRLVPAKRTSDSVVGMYDFITNTFYTNSASTGAFIAGPEIHPHQTDVNA